MADCYDSRHCVLRGSHFNDRECSCLQQTYEYDGQCPFCKRSTRSKGSRSPEYLAGVRKPIRKGVDKKDKKKGA